MVNYSISEIRFRDNSCFRIAKNESDFPARRPGGQGSVGQLAELGGGDRFDRVRLVDNYRQVASGAQRSAQQDEPERT